MKSFDFRLDQALRWRETQVSLQKARLAGAAGVAARAQEALDSQRAELTRQSQQVSRGATGTALESYAAYAGRAHARIRQLQEQAVAARQALDSEMNRLIEANRKVRLLENLKRAEHVRWTQQFDRELAAFADEAFLGKLQSKKRTGA
jgi:flagellar export protein FliJ